MAKPRTKKRTHVGAKNPGHKAPLPGRLTTVAQDPKSMVIRIGAGEVGSSVSQLAKDVRMVMEPGTASRLKERRANRLRDYVTMTGPLGVTHLLLFSRSESGNTNLRIATTPRGPTLHFRVEKYSLCKDVRRAQRHPKGGGKEYMTPPLLIMNNITTPSSDANAKVPRHLETLTTTVFQSLFPRINPQTTPLRSIRRVLLLDREPAGDEEQDEGTFVLSFRHYAITTKRASMSRPLRRLNAAERLLSTKKTRGNGVLPNLGKLHDISEYLIGGGEDGEGGYVTDGGATSGSEMDDTDAEVEVLESAPRRVPSAAAARVSRAAATAAAAAGNNGTGAGTGGNGGQVEAGDGDGDGDGDVDVEVDDDEKVELRRVTLTELGPRMRLRLTKVEEGLCTGKTMWHEHVRKSRQEVQELDRRWEQRQREKEARRKEQKANVERKQMEKQASSAKSGKGGAGDKEGGGDGGQEEEAAGGDDYDMYMDMDGNNSDLFDEMMERDDDDDDEFDSEGLAGDAEEAVHEGMDEDGWEDEQEEIANARS